MLVFVHVIVLEYRARSGSLSGILARTLNLAAAGRGGNRIGTIPKRSYDYDDDNDYGFSITWFVWVTCNSVPPHDGLLYKIPGYPKKTARISRNCDRTYDTGVSRRACFSGKDDPRWIPGKSRVSRALAGRTSAGAHCCAFCGCPRQPGRRTAQRAPWPPCSRCR